LSYLTNHAD